QGLADMLQATGQGGVVASQGLTFWGFRRPGGAVGVRNRLLVLSILGLTTPAARRVARSLPGSLLVAAPYGRGQLGEDAASYRRQMIGLGRNPNIGAVLVIGADRTRVDI